MELSNDVSYSSRVKYKAISPLNGVVHKGQIYEKTYLCEQSILNSTPKLEIYNNETINPVDYFNEAQNAEACEKAKSTT